MAVLRIINETGALLLPVNGSACVIFFL